MRCAVVATLALLSLAATACSGGGGGTGTPSVPKVSSISGVVKLEGMDAKPADPSGFTVQVEGHPTWKATPSSSGAYQLKEIPEGEYNVVLEAPAPPAGSVYSVRPSRREDVKVFGGLPTLGVDFQVETLPAPPSF